MNISGNDRQRTGQLNLALICVPQPELTLHEFEPKFLLWLCTFIGVALVFHWLCLPYHFDLPLHACFN